MHDCHLMQTACTVSALAIMSSLVSTVCNKLVN